MLLHCFAGRLHYTAPVQWDETAVARWLEPLAARPGEIADVFGERMREVTLAWRDGELADVRVRREEGVAARWRFGREERFAFAAGSGESSVREAVRSLRSAAGREARPLRGSRSGSAEDAEGSDLASWADATRWARKLTGMFGRHAPRHRFLWRIRETERRIVAPPAPVAVTRRRLVSLEGVLTAASRQGDEPRRLAFHAPDGDATADELKTVLAAAATPRDRPVAPPAGETDAALAAGSAAVLFHEILGHALEADALASPLTAAAEKRVAVTELDVHDDPRRLDLFGGYERDDEGTAPRPVKLLHSGHVGSRLTDRSHTRGPSSGSGSTGHGRRAGAAEPPGCRTSNVVVPAGSATSEELARRLNEGLWIEEFLGGSVDLSAGTFRLRFARARRVRRGRFTEELGPGILAGRILDALRNVEPVLGREARACRSLGWCSRDGQVVPVQGEAPDILIRRLAVRPAP
jgi:predicted Zn-dependent protease